MYCIYKPKITTGLGTVNLYSPEFATQTLHQPIWVEDKNTWDALATIPVVDEQIDTDTNECRSEHTRTQLAPRVLVISGHIETSRKQPEPPVKFDPLIAATNRGDFLMNILTTLAGGLEKAVLSFGIQNSNIGPAFFLNCHLHAPEGVKVVATGTGYFVTITLIAEDPRIYCVTTDSVSGIVGSGIVSVENTPCHVFTYPHITVSEFLNLTQVYCAYINDEGETTTQIVKFLEPLESGTFEVTCDIPYMIPRFVQGTTAANLDLSSPNNVAFLQIPPMRKTDFYVSCDGSAKMTVEYRHVLLSVPI